MNLDSKIKLLNLFSEEDFWSGYFALFIDRVHLAEFAHTKRDESGSQSELAFSACFQRVMIEYLRKLHINDWFPALEVLVELPPDIKETKFSRVDVSLFPWDPSKGLRKDGVWKVCKDPDEHIRFELKWLDRNNDKFTDYKTEIYDMLNIQNPYSNKHFVVILVFHGNDNKNLIPKEEMQHQGGYEFDGWKNIYFDYKKRITIFNEVIDDRYKYYSLVVYKR
jgi:hypothetical protein